MPLKNYGVDEMKVNIEEVPSEDVDTRRDEGLGAEREDGHEDEVLKLKMELEDKEKLYLNLRADFDNLKKRIERDAQLIVQEERGKLMIRILEVLDNFERAIEAAENYRHDPFSDGIIAIYRQLVTVLREYGVEYIESLGHEFDPNLHEAVAVVRGNDYKKNTVVDEVQRGYMMGDKLLRPSKVRVTV
ncbi:MAG: nucleotide exchange factor GrpE [Pseudomonadota bacterium]